MNTLQKIILVIVITLLVGLAFSAYMLLTVTFPVGAMNDDNTVSLWTEYREPTHTSNVAHVELVAPVNQSRCWLYSYTSRYTDSNKWMVDNCWILPDGDMVQTDDNNERDTGDTVSQSDNTPVVVTNNPVQDTPVVDNTPTNDAPQVDNPPADNPTSEDKPEKEHKEKGNNGHGNNNDGVDSSNPGNGPKNNDGADNSAPVDDEGHGGGNNPNN